jgi:hypothetical protein
MEKWIKRVRGTQRHEDSFCPHHHYMRDHWAGFSTREDIVKHFRRYHPSIGSESYECALGACALNLCRDNWDKSGLRQHLKDHHSIDFEITAKLTENCSGSSITVEILDAIEPGIKWFDCIVCKMADV